jgi:hypothetical protein
MEQGYALYLSYNRWLHEKPLRVDQFCAVAEATCHDPSDLEEQWDEGCYPVDGEVYDPNETDEDD